MECPHCGFHHLEVQPRCARCRKPLESSPLPPPEEPRDRQHPEELSPVEELVPADRESPLEPEPPAREEPARPTRRPAAPEPLSVSAAFPEPLAPTAEPADPELDDLLNALQTAEAGETYPDESSLAEALAAELAASPDTDGSEPPSSTWDHSLPELDDDTEDDQPRSAASEDEITDNLTTEPDPDDQVPPEPVSASPELMEPESETGEEIPGAVMEAAPEGSAAELSEVSGSVPGMEVPEEYEEILLEPRPPQAAISSVGVRLSALFPEPAPHGSDPAEARLVPAGHPRPDPVLPKPERSGLGADEEGDESPARTGTPEAPIMDEGSFPSRIDARAEAVDGKENRLDAFFDAIPPRPAPSELPVRAEDTQGGPPPEDEVSQIRIRAVTEPSLAEPERPLLPFEHGPEAAGRGAASPNPGKGKGKGLRPWRKAGPPVAGRDLALRRCGAGLIDSLAWLGLGLALYKLSALLSGAGSLHGTPGEWLRLVVVPILLMSGILAVTSGSLFGSLLGQTPGMMLFGLRLVTPEGSRPRLGRVFLRTAVFLLSVLPLGLGLVLELKSRGEAGLAERVSRMRLNRV